MDLPTAEDRADIFRVHLTKRHRDSEAFDLQELAQAADGFSGAEIEAAVKGALLDAFMDGPRDLATPDRRPQGGWNGLSSWENSGRTRARGGTLSQTRTCERPQRVTRSDDERSGDGFGGGRAATVKERGSGGQAQATAPPHLQEAAALEIQELPARHL